MLAIEQLEPRELLSIKPAGPDIFAPGPDAVKTFDLAVAGDGSSIIVTVDDSTPPRLTAIRYSQTGEQIGKPLKLDTLSVDSNTPRASVAMDADGDAVVIYVRDYVDLEMIRISRDGQLTHRKSIHTGTGDESAIVYPSVSMDEAGRFFVGWIPFLSTGHDDKVVIRAFNADGTARGEEFTAAGPSDLSSFSDLDLDVKPDGSAAVFVYNELSEGTGKYMHYGRVTTRSAISQPSAGIKVAGAVSVSTFAKGSFLLAYDRSNESLSTDATEFASYVQRFDLHGNALGNEIAVGETLAGEGLKKQTRFASVAAMPDGGFVAAYSQKTGDAGAIYVSRYDLAGRLDPSGDVKIASVAARQTAIGAADTGDIVAAYLKGPDDTQLPGVLHFRHMRADSAYIKRAELFVLGTDAADSIRIAPDGGRIVVFRGGTFKTFDASLIANLTVNGYGGNDSIKNETALRCTLSGGNGSDTLTGGPSADVLHGDDGDDTLAGGDGNDKLFGDGGVDSLSGNAGADLLAGGAGNDRLAGNGGRDKLYGDDGNDDLFGGASGDVLHGDDGDDELNGEGGDDQLFGDLGADRLHGNAGDDHFQDADNTIDHLFGDGGTDGALVDQIDVLTSIENHN